MSQNIMKMTADNSTHAPVPHSKHQAELQENLFPPTGERVAEYYDWLYQNSIRKCEDDLEH